MLLITTTHLLSQSEILDLVLVLACSLFLLPKGQVLLQKLNDALSITKVVLTELVNLIESALKGTFGEFASLCAVL